MRRTKSLSLIIIIVLTLIFIANMITKTYATNSSEELSDWQKAFKEIAYAYYMRGPKIQYNSMKVAWFSPEEATSQNTNYLVCSGLTRNVYNELLGIVIPVNTPRLLDYSEEFIGNPEVIAFGNRDANNNLVMKLYDKSTNSASITLTNPSVTDILPYLKCGDILTYTGHTMLVYDMVYDENGDVVDARIMESGHGNGGYNVKTKIPNLISIGNDITFGSSNNFLYHNSRYNTTCDDGLIEGSVHLSTLKNVTVWRNLEASTKERYSILRFIDKNSDGYEILNYHGANFGDKDHNNEIINLSEKCKDRVKFSKLYIEKTVSSYTDDVVEENDELTYTLVVKNNSAEDYEELLNVSEKINDNVQLISHETNHPEESNVTIITNSNDNSQTISWGIRELKSGEEYIIKYTVKVKENSENNVIESTGTVNNIPTTVIKNTIGKNLTESQENSIKEKYDELSRQFQGKELVNEVYKQAIGKDIKFNEFDITNLVNDTNASSTGASTISLNSNNSFYKSVLNKYYNTLSVIKHSYENDDIYAYYLKGWKSYTNILRRADTINSENFKTGDILIYKNDNDVIYKYANNVLTKTPVTYESGEYAYIYIEGKGFVGVNLGNDGIAGTQDDRNEFNAKYYSDNNLFVYSNTEETDESILEFANYQTLLGKDYYVILRPSLMILQEDAEIDPIFELEKYELSNNTIKNIQPNTNYTDFIKNINTNMEYIIKEGEKDVTGTDRIKTGQVLTVGENTYTLVVTGDTNGDGKADIKDILKINKHRLNKTQLTDCYYEAGDVNKDEKVDIRDILRINKYRLGKINTL